MLSHTFMIWDSIGPHAFILRLNYNNHVYMNYINVHMYLPEKSNILLLISLNLFGSK